MCPVLGHELDRKKGNVFYDVKKRYLRQDLEGTLFEGQVDTSIVKGKKLFDHPVSMDICTVCVKLCQDRIRDKVTSQYSKELFFSEYHGKEFSVQVQNIRAERRETRDLMQDLEDIRSGLRNWSVSARRWKRRRSSRLSRSAWQIWKTGRHWRQNMYS